LSATADLHTGNAFLPTANKALEWERDGLTARPRGIELFSGLKINAHVVDLDNGSGLNLCAISDGDIE
jgi:hypothetical protein